MANERILVVDDQPMVAETCAEILADAGYQVDLACAGRKALDKLEAESFDLLVSDLKMPEVDGLTVLRRAKELYPNLTAVMITSYASLENAIDALRAGARDFLLKPFDPDDLVTTVRSVLATQNREQETLTLRGRLASAEENLCQERELRQALEKAKALYHNLVETSQDLIWQCDADGVFTFLNQAWRETLGYELEEMLGRRFYDFQPPKHTERDKEIFAQGLKGDSAKGYETVYLTKDGRIIDLIFNAKPMYDENADIVGAHGTAHDITERKRVEEDLRNALAELEAIHQNAPMAMLVVDRELRLQKINGFAARFAERPETEMIGLRGGEALRCVHHLEDPRGCGFAPACASCRVRQIVLDTFHSKANQQEVEAWLSFSRGGMPSERCLLLSTAYLELDAADRVLLCARDITDQKLAENRLKDEKAWSDAIISAAPNIVVGLGEHSEILIFNKFAEKATGYTAQEVMGREWIDLMIPEAARPEIHRVWQEIVENRLVEHHFENPILTRAGAQRLISWNNTVLLKDAEFKLMLSIGEDITERKETERALRESEEKFRSLIEQIPAMVYLSPFPGSEVEAYVSPYTQTLGGYDLEQFHVAGAWRKMVHPDDLPRLDKNYQRALQTGETVRQEFRAFTQDGRPLWVQETYWTVRDETGEPLYQQGIVLDITERKEVEAALRQSEERYRSLVEQAPDAIYVHVDDRVVLVNRACLQLFGARSEDELLGKSVYDFTHPDYHDIVRGRIHHQIEWGEPVPPIEEKMFRIDGSIVDVEVTAAPFSFGDGKAIHAIVRDITERKQVEAALCESEERYRSLVENAPDGIYIHFNDRVILVNQACLQLFGARSEEELLGKSIFELFHPDSHPVVRERIVRLRDRGEPVPPVEEKIVRMDGTVVDVETTAGPFSFSGGNAVHVIIRDITERKQIAAQLTEQLDELRRWHRATLGRETRVLELKREVNELLRRLGGPMRYPSAEQKSQGED